MGLAIAVASTMKIPEVQLSDGELQIDVRQSEDGSGFENVHIDEAQAPVEKVPDIDMTGIPGSTVFAQQNKAISGWLIVLRHPQNSLIGIAFLFIAWIMGIGAGLIFTFLFWHLQDFGGTTTLFGLACLVNQVSEIAAYFFAPQFIIRLGHVNVLCVGLLCNVVRFLYISFLTNPWWVLPLEFVQGITHATIWAASCSYLTKNTPQDLKLQDQNVLEGLYHGLGRGFGTVIGGILVTSLGTRPTFMLYSIICAITLVGFLLLTCYKKKEIGQINRLQEVGPHNIAADTGRSSK
ncbi:major facilitator superfamily domain-containing protein 6 isoform X2 [Folsomia candida]|nr:major facilitator superfamily domain-containing protein 6 isoform X2 [Folsomia candida]XP_035712171.1 major facilitator superfamily domain-containing protein 6 isoform X2 [Folsomia candida]